MPEAKWFVLLFCTYGIATLVAANPDMNSRFLGYLINTWVIMLVAFYFLDTEKKIELGLIFFILGAAYIGYEGMVVGRNAAGRVEGIGTVDSPEANTIAASIVPVISLITYFGWIGGWKAKAMAAVCGLLVANGLILINSRGAFLGGALSLGYFLSVMMFSKYKLPKQRLFSVLLIFVITAAVIRLVDETFIERMSTLSEQTTIKDEGSGSRRVHFWLATFDLLNDHPLGAGIYGYDTLSPIYLDPKFLGEEFGSAARAVHSLWFQALSEVGWIGFAAFVFLLVSLYRHLRRAKQILIAKNKLKQYYLLIAIEAGMLGFLVSCSFINMFRSQILYWMLLYGICASVVMIRCYGSNSTENVGSVKKVAGDDCIDEQLPGIKRGE